MAKKRKVSNPTISKCEHCFRTSIDNSVEEKEGESFIECPYCSKTYSKLVVKTGDRHIRVYDK